MAERRRPIELSVERTVTDPNGGSPLLLRATVRLEEGLDATAPGVAEELATLRRQLDAVAATLAPSAPAPSRPDRPLEELVEAYRPRQTELLELLREEGELTAGEYELLRRHMGRPETPRPPPAGIPLTDRPIAAAPLENDRAPATPRAVEELLRRYQISSLKQAGAVRARRQISFEEYMALKRHFGTPAAP